MVGLYDYYKMYCVCPGEDHFIGMKTLEGEEVGGWPVYVYNVNEVQLAVAENKEQYIAIWNSDAANSAIGKLSGANGPFFFVLTTKRHDIVIPEYVIGDNDGLMPDEALIDIDGEALIDIDDEILIDL